MTPVNSRKPYTPSREMIRRLWVIRQNIRRPVSRPAHPVRDNSVPWGPAPRSVADAIALIEAMESGSEEARKSLLPK